MNPIYEKLIFAIIFAVLVWQYSTRDSHGMDIYDRTVGVAGEGRTRGLLGIVYDADGTFSHTYNLIDTNPCWLEWD
jgi:hypothetical protein